MKVLAGTKSGVYSVGEGDVRQVHESRCVRELVRCGDRLFAGIATAATALFAAIALSIFVVILNVQYSALEDQKNIAIDAVSESFQHVREAAIDIIGNPSDQQLLSRRFRPPQMWNQPRAGRTRLRTRPGRAWRKPTTPPTQARIPCSSPPNNQDSDDNGLAPIPDAAPKRASGGSGRARRGFPATAANHSDFAQIADPRPRPALTGGYRPSPRHTAPEADPIVWMSTPSATGILR